MTDRFGRFMARIAFGMGIGYYAVAGGMKDEPICAGLLIVFGTILIVIGSLGWDAD